MEYMLLSKLFKFPNFFLLEFNNNAENGVKSSQSASFCRVWQHDAGRIALGGGGQLYFRF